MARMFGPDDAYRTVYLPDGRARARGYPVTLYADEQLTMPADVLTTLGEPVPESTVIVDAYSRVPLVLYPDGADVVYTSINGGPPVALYARIDDRLDQAITSGLQPNANLGDVPSPAVARQNLGLGNVNNTADADKPVSTATLAALNAKAPINSPTFTGTVAGVTKAHVGLGNVDNTSDAAKPVSTAAQAALNARVAKGELMVSVSDYGAKGDGTTDDTAAINAALAAAQPGGRVFFPQPAVHYKITDGLQVRTPRLRIEGASRGVEIHQYTWCKPAFDILDCDDVTISDLTMRYVGASRAMPGTSTRGSNSYVFSAGVWTNGNRNTIRECRMVRFTCGVNLSPWSTATNAFVNGHVGNVVDRCEFENYDFGVLYVGQDGLRLTNCYAHDDLDASGGQNATHAYYGSDNGTTWVSNNVYISGWICTGNKYGQAFQVRGTKGLVVTDHLSDGCQGLGNYADLVDAKFSNMVGRDCYGGSLTNGGLTLTAGPSLPVGNSRVTISDIAVYMTYEGRAFFWKGEDLTLRNLYVESKRQGTNTADHDVLLRGARMIVDGVHIKGVGSTPAQGIGVGHGETVQDVSISNVSGDNITNLIYVYGGSTNVQVALNKAMTRGLTGQYIVGPATLQLGNVDNTSDANKPVSTAAQAALNAKAPLASPTFTGTVQATGGFARGRRAVADTNVTVTNSDSVVAYTSLTAARVVTLPAQGPTLPAGQEFTIKDESGACDGTKTITITPAAGTIDGAANLVLNAAYARAALYTNGTNWYTR